MRTVLVGAVESSRVALECIARTAGWSVELVLTLPPARAARHSDFVDLNASARAAGALIQFVDNINADEALRGIERAQPDFVFVVGWSQICGREFRNSCGQGLIGYHPSALPRLRGRAVIPWTILSGEAITAGTLFWIDEGVDSGAILAQEFFHVAPDESAASLYRKHMEALERMMGRTLESLRQAEPPRIAQDETYATWAARRTQSDGRIDWRMPGIGIDRLIRALGGPYPTAFTFDGLHQLGIERAQLLREEQRFVAVPGQVVAVADGHFLVKCGDAVMKVTEWTHPEQRPPKLHSILADHPEMKPNSSNCQPPVALAFERSQERRNG